MKTARKMFKKAGFKLTMNNHHGICYTNEDDEEIYFVFTSECIDINVCCVDKDVYKAIQKQIEELGWNDEEC